MIEGGEELLLDDDVESYTIQGPVTEADVLSIDDEDEEYASSEEEKTELDSDSYPHIVVGNLLFTKEVHFLLDRVSEGDKLIPLYVKIDNEDPEEVGMFNVTLKNILLCMHRRYSLDLVFSPSEKIDLTDGDNLYNFIGS